jgi:hypothetical protein
MATPVWKGSTKIEEQPGSPKYTESGSGEKVVRTFRGPYSTLFGTRPRKGGTMTGYDGFVIDEVYLEPDGAGPDGPGTMTVTLLKDDFITPITTGGTAGVVEVEWTEIRKSLEEAPMYNGAKFNGAKLTDENVVRDDPEYTLAQLWDDIKNAGTRKTRDELFKNVTSANHRQLLAHLWKKHSAGQTDYVIFAPVVRTTTKSYTPPTSTKCGKKVNKPAPTAPDGYEWMQSADRALKQGGNGKWERVREFTGVDKVDTDFYPNA